MFQHLVAAGPHPSLGAHAADYGRFIGSWRGTYRDPDPRGEEVGPMEVHFAWALEGRAVQDVWIAPSGPLPGGATARRHTYGSTMRIFDPATAAWRVSWFNPARQVSDHLVGRRVGDDVIQTGYWNDRPQRWCFLEVTPDSFLWQAHGLADDGVSWDLQTEFRLARVR